MDFEWDEEKAASNIEKHGIDFPFASKIFEGQYLSKVDDRKDYGETRLIALGEYDGLILLVVFAQRADAIRIISARRARRDERKNYRAIIASEN
jgi:uncharacterized protein